MTSQQTIDDLQYQKTQLVKQIHEAERQLTSLDTQIKTLEQVTKESPHILTVRHKSSKPLALPLIPLVTMPTLRN